MTDKTQQSKFFDRRIRGFEVLGHPFNCSQMGKKGLKMAYKTFKAGEAGEAVTVLGSKIRKGGELRNEVFEFLRAVPVGEIVSLSQIGDDIREAGKDSESGGRVRGLQHSIQNNGWFKKAYEPTCIIEKDGKPLFKKLTEGIKNQGGLYKRIAQ